MSRSSAGSARPRSGRKAAASSGGSSAISPRIDRALDVRDRGIGERAHDVDERVGGAEVAELLRGDRLPGRGGLREAEVAVRDLGVRRLLRLEQRGEPVDALVGYLRDPDVRLGLGSREAAGRRVRAGEQVEERRLPDVRQAGDRGGQAQWLERRLVDRYVLAEEPARDRGEALA